MIVCLSRYSGILLSSSCWFVPWCVCLIVVCLYVSLPGRFALCMYVALYVCQLVWMYECRAIVLLCVCMHICMYVCIVCRLDVFWLVAVCKIIRVGGMLCFVRSVDRYVGVGLCMYIWLCVSIGWGCLLLVIICMCA